ASPSPALAGVEHDRERQRDAPVVSPPGVGGEVEHVAVEQRELPVELADDLLVRAAHQQEVRAQDAEERAEDPAQEREDDRVLDRLRERPTVGASTYQRLRTTLWM